MITTSEFCKREYGEKLYKLSLDGGFTCPNRDGTLDSRGCIFCSGLGSGDFATGRNLPLDIQIERAKKLVDKKFSGNHYIAYFQSFTNTYASLSKLKEIYEPLLDREDIKVISIATRADCLNDEIIEYLSFLNGKKPIWVELGLQTTKKESISYIRRCFDTSVYDEKIKKLNERKIHTITHVILGLPNETREDMLNTVKHVVSVKSAGIKLQLLHVLKGTDLAKEYLDKKFEVLSEDEYINILKECINILPKDMVIHRLSGDGPKSLLIAPLWSANKKEVLNKIHREISL